MTQSGPAPHGWRRSERSWANPCALYTRDDYAVSRSARHIGPAATGILAKPTQGHEGVQQRRQTLAPASPAAEMRCYFVQLQRAARLAQHLGYRLDLLGYPCDAPGARHCIGGALPSPQLEPPQR